MGFLIPLVAAGASAAAGASGAAGIASAVLGLAGGIFSGIEGYQSNQFQAKVAGYNAQLAAQQAQASAAQGATEQSAELMKTSKLVGSVAASEAAGNVDVGGGSATDLRTSIKSTGIFNASMLRYNAALQSYGFHQQQQEDYWQQQEYKSASWKALIGGVLGGLGSFASGVSGTASKLSQFGTNIGDTGGGLNVPSTSGGLNSDDLLLSGSG